MAGATNLPTITVQAALAATSTSSALWDTAVWDTGVWGAGFALTDITKYVLSFRTRFGRQRETDHFAAGSGTLVLDNSDGRFSPDNLSGPYVSGGVTQIRPWRAVIITAVWNSVTYNVWYGYAKTWTDTYPMPNRTITTVSMVDGLAVLGGHNGTAGQASVGDSESTGVRIQRLLSDAQWALNRNIDVGTQTCQATNLSANTLQEIQLTADSEGGAFWVDYDGTACFERGYALIENTRSNTSQATFGDGAGENPYETVEMLYDGDLLWNQANFQRTGGNVQTSSDASSIATYGERVYNSPQLVCQNDAITLGLAQFFVVRYKDPEARILSMNLHPAANTSLWPQVLGRRIRDRVTVKRRPNTSTSYTINRDVFIDGIEHSFDAGTNDWQTTFRLSSATAWTQTTGRWDSAIWDTSTWFY